MEQFDATSRDSLFDFLMLSVGQVLFILIVEPLVPRLHSIFFEWMPLGELSLLHEPWLIESEPHSSKFYGVHRRRLLPLFNFL